MKHAEAQRYLGLTDEQMERAHGAHPDDREDSLPRKDDYTEEELRKYCLGKNYGWFVRSAHSDFPGVQPRTDGYEGPHMGRTRREAYQHNELGASTKVDFFTVPELRAHLSSWLEGLRAKA